MNARRWKYRAVDAAGRPRRGITTAPTESEVYRELAAAGLTPITIAEDSAAAWFSRRGVKAEEVVQLTRQLSSLQAAGIPLAEALQALGAQEPSRALRDILTDVAGRVQSGEPVHEALSRYRDVFGVVYIETIRVAEKSGDLRRVLDYLADMLERGREVRRQVIGALIYPAVVSAILLVAVAFLMGFVVPRFARMFDERQMQLPTITRVMIALSESVQHFWWVYLLAFACAGAGVWVLSRNQAGRETIDAWLHRLPVIRGVLVGYTLARFSRVMALCAGSGMSVIDSLELAARAAGRPLLTRDVALMADRMRAGARLSEVLIASAYLPATAQRMLKAGDDSSQLDRMCALVADQYERQTSALAKTVSTVIEPVLVVLIAAVVLAVALSVFLPMWDMMNAGQ